MPDAFNEMMLPDGTNRPGYETLQRWLDQMPADLLSHRRAEAELLFRRIGITFAVYGDNEAEERIIPFDIIPRIVTKEEWARLSHGLEQRAKALNLFLADVYGPARILKEKVVPADLIYRNPYFRPEMTGLKLRHNISMSMSPASTSSGSTGTISTSLRTMPARPPGSPICWRTAR